MKEMFKRIKGEFILSSIMCMILGIVMIVWGHPILIILGRILNVILIAIGAVYLLGFFLNGMKNGFSAAIGAVVFLVGIWGLANPAVIVSIIPIIIGVLLIGHGVKEFMVALESKRYGYERWGIGVLLAIISLILGVLCVINAFGLMELAFYVIGAALIYNGISNIWVVSRASKAEKAYRMDKEVIDVEFKD